MIVVKYLSLNQLVKHHPQTPTVSSPLYGSRKSDKVAIHTDGRVVFLHYKTEKWVKATIPIKPLCERYLGEECFVLRKGRIDNKGRPLYFRGLIMKTED